MQTFRKRRAGLSATAGLSCYLRQGYEGCVYVVVLVLYLKLENVTKLFRHPCVMDIKVGPITYDHEADEAKIAREKAKSPSLPQVRFQIVGIRVRGIKSVYILSKNQVI